MAIELFTLIRREHFALDTETGSFEVVNKNGKHQGEINFDGVKISEADKSGKHDLIVK